MNYRFVAIDVDGTLLDSNKNLSLYTKETIQRCIASGITVCICTGRPLQTIDRFTELLGVKECPAIQNAITARIWTMQLPLQRLLISR